MLRAPPAASLPCKPRRDEEGASAANGGGWLHLSIHYTGYELDQVGMGGRYMGHKALDVADAPGKGGESIRLSEDGRQEDAPNNRWAPFAARVVCFTWRP